MSNIWYILGPGLVIAFIGTRIRHRNSVRGLELPWGPAADATPLGRAVFLVGMVVTVVSLYAGFKGPVEIGSLTLPAFKSPKAAFDSMVNDPLERAPKKAAPRIKKDYENALAYARAKLSFTANFYGEGGLRFRGTIENVGDRRLSYIELKLEAPGGKTGRLRLNGPFPVGGKAVPVNEPLPKEFHMINKRIFIIDAAY